MHASVRFMLAAGAIAIVFALSTRPASFIRAEDEPRRSPTPVPVALRVMSFNIRYDNAGDGEDGWEHRKDKAASMIRFHRADLVGLQEALHHQLDDLVARLPDFSLALPNQE